MAPGLSHPTPANAKEMKPTDLNAIAAKLPLSKSTLARNANLAPSSYYVPPSPAKRIRQSSKPLLNKLEADFLRHLQAVYFATPIHSQAKRYRLGNGIWYKPDFTAQFLNTETDRHQEYAWEVKGPHAFRGGFENLKVAASTWPEVRWILVWKEHGEWRDQIILP